MDQIIGDLQSIITTQLQSALDNKAENEKIIRAHVDLVKNLMLEIIDTLDTFEQIEESIIEKGINRETPEGRMMNRYQLIRKKLIFMLEQQGISLMQFPNNKIIVGGCEVIDSEPDLSRGNEEIIAIIRNGYMKGDEIIRPAKVIIVRN